MDIVFLGPPACGKGTQAEILCSKFDFRQISTGAILRNEVESQGKFSLEIKTLIEKGELVPDNLIVNLLLKELENNKGKNFLFDGFPRVKSQIYMLKEIMEKQKRDINKVFYFDISTDLLIMRVMGRFSCSKCEAVYNEESKKPKIKGVCDICGHTDFVKRSDDSSDVLSRRISIFEKETMPIKEYYDQKKILVNLKADSTVEEVNKNILSALNI
jgi:adenylate kinase